MRLIILILFLCSSSSLFAQKYLLLRKIGRPYKTVFEEGQYMRFKLKGERFFTKALIQGFGKDDIRFHYYRIKLDEIAEVDVSDRKFTEFNYSSGSAQLVVAGVGYLAVDQFNQTVINDRPFGVNKRTAIISGAIISSGFLLRFIQKKRFKMSKKRHVMEIIDLES